jgi:hypothetical protein
MKMPKNQPIGFSENFGINPFVCIRFGTGIDGGLKDLPAAPSLYPA